VLPASVPVCGIDKVQFHREIVAKEVGGIGAVREDAADLGSGQKDVLRLFGREETFDRLSFAKIESARVRRRRRS
jgi:hypothetical protein